MEPVTERLWVPRNESPDFSALDEFVDQLQLSHLVARILISRLPSLENARHFLAARLAELPDPFLLADMESAVDRLQVALEKRYSIEYFVQLLEAHAAGDYNTPAAAPDTPVDDA